MANPFQNKVFRHIRVNFKVQSGQKEIDSRGNTKTVGEIVSHTFKVGSASPQIRKEFESTHCDETLTAYCLEGALDRRIRPGDIGEGEYLERQCTVELRSLVQSSIIPVTKILGERYILLLRFKSRGGNA